ncbi:DNA mismatch repair endonuclease MutL [Halocatena marina]|uniref:DNA mismatch repair endonuclease MutL n=1 Tax=Halocatena marina TaxID=2934937 RepID=UPI00200BF04A|nr:DNA mismatch repair endonuclease MutL [Halocatena marina]
MSDEQDERIHELDDRTIERIAAGEVVERPASAVKELIENSLDADASRVTVAVEAGGTERIQVSDDGTGMTEADAKRAVEKHTTSKIDDINDLEAGVRTLGFRGEALHAISAVSRVTVTTKPRDGTRGTEVRIEGGERTHVGPAGCPEGTTVEVTDLFYNVPARRKYLKQESTEFDHIQRVVTGYALSNPGVSFTLEHDGRERFSTSGRGDLQGTVMAVYGREVASAMIDLSDDDLPDGPLTEIEGLVSHPETNRASREYCTAFVNGRYVTARAVREAIIEAYGSQLAPDRYPFAVVVLDLDPEQVDVNVHPRKLEVRFADETKAREQVRYAVENALLDAGLIRSSAPRGRSAPKQTELEPGQESTDEDLDREQSSDSTTGESTDRDEKGGREKRTDENESDPKRSQESAPTVSETETVPSETEPSEIEPSRQSAGQNAPVTEQEGNESGEAERTEATGTSTDVRTNQQAQSTESRTSTESDPHISTSIESGSTEDSDSFEQERRFRRSTTQTRLGDDAPEPTSEFDRLPSLRVLGQIHDTYLIAETDDGLVLIDQHAADERVNYERLKREFAEETTAQALAEPVRLELTAREATLFEEYVDALAQLGFHASLVEERVAEVRTVPGLLAGSVGPTLVRDLLTAFVTGDSASTVEAAADDLLSDLACYPSITGNTSLTEGSIIDLLRTLDDCENPYACPHGRPVIIEISQRELEERFERDYPGHDGRRE